MNANIVSIRKSKECYSLKVCCPYCGNLHSHGGGEPVGEILLGSRSAHCGKGEYNLKLSPEIIISDTINAVSHNAKRRPLLRSR
jgi:hypothetical protein